MENIEVSPSLAPETKTESAPTNNDELLKKIESLEKSNLEAQRKISQMHSGVEKYDGSFVKADSGLTQEQFDEYESEAKVLKLSQSQFERKINNESERLLKLRDQVEAGKVEKQKHFSESVYEKMVAKAKESGIAEDKIHTMDISELEKLNTPVENTVLPSAAAPSFSTAQVLEKNVDQMITEVLSMPDGGDKEKVQEQIMQKMGLGR